MEDNTATSQAASLLDRLFAEELAFAGEDEEIREEIVQIVADLEARVTLLETALAAAGRPRPIWSGWYPQ